MRIAALAGIQLFVTGGLGGVHQGAESVDGRLGRPHRALAHRGRRRLGRGEVDPRHRAGPSRCSRPSACRSSGSAPTSSRPSSRGPAGCRCRCGSTPPRRWRPAGPRHVGLGLDGGVAVANPVPAERRDAAGRRSTGVIDAGARRVRRARGPRQGHHPVPARADRRAVRRRGAARPTSPWSATTPGSARPSPSPTPRIGRRHAGGCAERPRCGSVRGAGAGHPGYPRAVNAVPTARFRRPPWPASRP